jgi:hypothetical protein
MGEGLESGFGSVIRWPGTVRSWMLTRLGISDVSAYGQTNPLTSMSSSRAVSIVFANLEGNVGDFAIPEGMIRQMARRYPGQGIEVFSQSRLPVDEDRFRVFREGVWTCHSPTRGPWRTYPSCEAPSR